VEIIKIDHLGIAVKNIKAGETFWTDALGITCEGSEIVEEQNVLTAFFPVGESEVELLEPTSEGSPVAKFLDKKGEGIHHIAFRVKNIEAALSEKEKERALPYAIIDKVSGRVIGSTRFGAIDRPNRRVEIGFPRCSAIIMTATLVTFPARSSATMYFTGPCLPD